MNRLESPRYVIRKAEPQPELNGLWDGPAWSRAEPIAIDHFYARSSDHRPEAQAKLLHDEDRLYAIFRVRDRYVRSTRTDFNAMVCRDACAELFVEPVAGMGYFNFETNCGGTMLISYIEDPTRTPDGFVKFTRLPESLGKMVQVFHSLPPIVYPEIQHAVEWCVEYAIPRTVFEAYVGPLAVLSGQTWRGNLYKCADENSHPHWASWAPLGERLDFHQPQFFAPLSLE